MALSMSFWNLLKAIEAEVNVHYGDLLNVGDSQCQYLLARQLLKIQVRDLLDHCCHVCDNSILDVFWYIGDNLPFRYQGDIFTSLNVP